MDHGRVDIGCANLAALIGYACRVPSNRVIGPDWLTGSKFDVAAKLPEGASAAQMPEMLQSLLAERFQLAIHRGTREEPATALVIAKGGLKAKEGVPLAVAARPGDGAIVHVGGFEALRATLPEGGYVLTNPRLGTVQVSEGPNHSYRWQSSNITMAGMADLLNNGVGFIPEVVDVTGVGGRYQVDMQISLSDTFGAAAVTPADIQDSLLKDFNRALAPLGLQLEHRKATVETIVVDHAEKTPSGN